MRGWFAVIIGFAACEPQSDSEDILGALLRLSPLEAAPLDLTNAVGENSIAAAFGEQLFNDTRLSANGEISCASCHTSSHGFADDLPLSMGLSTPDRHTPSVLNSAWSRWFFWDGRADSAWSQALKPLESDAEHGFNRLAIGHLLESDATLNSEYEAVFGPLPDFSDLERFPADARPMTDENHADHIAWEAMTTSDQETINRVFSNIGKAIAAHERTLNRKNAPFDKYVEALKNGEQNAEDHLGPDALVGLNLFIGRANCVLCHSGPTFSDLQFHNIGLTPAPWADPTDRGRYDGIPIVHEDPFNGIGLYSDDVAFGAAKIDFIAQDSERLGQFKTPSLRNVALSPPYMHSGQLASLEDVVTFYDEANQEPKVGHRDELVVPLELTDAEKRGLVAFLVSLTGEAP